jgi:hypothetical protein
MPPLDRERWGRVRQLYEQTATPLKAIGAEVGVSSAAICGRAAHQGWIRFAGARKSQRQLPKIPSRAELIARLYRAFEKQIAEVEARFGQPSADEGEQDARTLGTLARTLEKLIELDRERTEDRDTEEPPDLARLRQTLSDRLRRLAGGGA